MRLKPNQGQIVRFENRWSAQPFPEILPGRILFADFGRYADTNDSNILVTNDCFEFQAHKKILSACSSVFKDFIEGDSTLKKIPVKCSNEALKFMQEMIYADPRDRLNSKELQDEAFQLEIVEIIARWDVQLLRALLQKTLEDGTFDNAKSLQIFCNEAKRVKENELAKTAEESFIRSAHCDVNISNANEDLVLRMIAYYKGENVWAKDDCRKAFVNIAKYAKTKSSKNVTDALFAVIRETSTGYNRLERNQARMLEWCQDLLEALIA